MSPGHDTLFIHSVKDLRIVSIMLKNNDYLDRLQVAIQELHRCGAVYRQTVPVHEVFRGETVWQGQVEVFDLTAHPKAKRCYALEPSGGEKRPRRTVCNRAGTTPG